MERLRELEREKGISFDTILAGLEEALGSAYKAWMRQHDPDLDEEATGVRVHLDPNSGAMRAWVQELDVDTSDVLSEREVEVPEDFLGRIAAQTAKQVMLQKLRDAEREMTYDEF